MSIRCGARKCWPAWPTDTGDLGSVDDLPQSVVDEMKALEIHDLFARHPRAGRRTGSVQ